MSWWTIAWLAWLAIFGVIEGFAIANSQRGDTLSEHVWAWVGIRVWERDTPERNAEKYDSVNAWTRLRRFVLVAFLAWLVVHFLTGGWV